MKGFFKMEEKMMQDAGQKKRSTYYAESQKRYNEKRKKVACSVSNKKYEEIRLHAEKKGYNSLNSYLIDLIENDMK